MTLRQSLLGVLRELLGTEPGLAVIHSSLADIGSRDVVNHWDVLYGLHCLINQGWTLALPAFTFSFCGGRPFHYLRSPSEVGILAQWVLADHPDAVRTPHPIYSFVVAGPKADSLVKCPSTTTFGDDSPFGLFERENAALMMLGCDWRFATQFHRYEEKAAVSYRYFKEFAGRADLGDGKGERDVRASMYVRRMEVDPVNDFTPAISRLRAEGSIAEAPLHRASVQSVRIADVARVSRDLLANDPLVFLANASEVDYKLTKISQSIQEPPLRAAVLGSANVHLLRSAFAKELNALLPDRRTEVREVPYGQLSQSLLDPASELRRWQPDVSIFCDRLEDLLGQGRVDDDSRERLVELVAQYAGMIAGYHAGNGGWTIVHRFAVLYRRAGEDDGLVLTGEMNAELQRRLGDLNQLLWVDVAGQAAAGSVAVVDFRLWHTGRFPYSEPFSRIIARHWAGLILAILGKSVRAIVVDLDNTLWGGILGEDGIAAIQLGGDFPGNAYLEFQRVLKSLIRRGIAIAVCSKNDEDLALQAIDGLPAMQVRSNDIVAYRFNWREKWQNIREIASELNLGIESLLFVDDNPTEREAARRNLPGLKVLDLPADPALYAQALVSSPWLEVVTVTAEDRKRVESYKSRRQVEEQRAGAANLEDFFASLEMKLHFQPLNDGNILRAVQLCSKTNQFNTTTRRYGQRDLLQIAAEGDDVVVLGIQDRYSELENIGVIILRSDPGAREQGIIDSYLLSCRVLGRGIETAVLQWALRRAAARYWRVVTGAIIETERNTPVREVFRDAGFQPGTRTGEWTARADPAAELPRWLTVIDSVDRAEIGTGR
jgi:FkbH-like protein